MEAQNTGARRWLRIGVYTVAGGIGLFVAGIVLLAVVAVLV